MREVNFDGEAADIGPSVMWGTRIKDKDIYFSAKWLHEFHAERRLEGDHFYISFTMAF